MGPRLLLILTENHTMRPSPDVGDLVRIGVDLGSVESCGVKTMTEQARQAHKSGTWGPREAAAEWRRRAAARLQAFGPATELMLDLARVAEGSRYSTWGPAQGIRHWWLRNAPAPPAAFWPQTSLRACWRSPRSWHGKRA